ncbi:hypothetical protein MKC66_10990 [[Clostridium] innocuum]|nr:hypothetical protein [[Clostridium] innocuum]
MSYSKAFSLLKIVVDKAGDVLFACFSGVDSFFYKKLDIGNPIIRINTAFKDYSSIKKVTILPRIYHD